MSGQLRCEPRRPTVQAAAHRGDAAAILAWVLAASHDPSVAGQCVDDGAVVVLEHVQGLSAADGDLPGGRRHSSPRWPVRMGRCDASTFRSSYSVAPRELPVFDDGEVV